MLLLLRHQAPFLEWLVSIQEKMGNQPSTTKQGHFHAKKSARKSKLIIHPLTIEDLWTDCIIINAPDIKHSKEFTAYFLEHSKPWIETACGVWCKDKSLWPIERDLDALFYYFNVEIYDHTFDFDNPLGLKNLASNHEKHKHIAGINEPSHDKRVER
jgi:hypothetical protein